MTASLILSAMFGHSIARCSADKHLRDGDTDDNACGKVADLEISILHQNCKPIFPAQ